MGKFEEAFDEARRVDEVIESSLWHILREDVKERYRKFHAKPKDWEPYKEREHAKIPD